MLNIDYSTPRKFLMSSGITLVLLGFIIFFGTAIFMTERLDALQTAINTNNTIILDLYNETYPTIIKSANMLEIFSVLLVFFGIILLFIGLKRWKNLKYTD